MVMMNLRMEKHFRKGKNSLKENRKKDSKALFQIYQTIEMPVCERIVKAETSKEAGGLGDH